MGIMPARVNAGSSGAEAFEKLKTLVGTGRRTRPIRASLSGPGVDVWRDGGAGKFHVVENGKPVEMTTLYYLDGDQVKLTHYCMAATSRRCAERMRRRRRTITFDLVDISNLKSADDGHMHHAVYTFIDNDHFKTTWTFRKEQKDAFTEDVTYVRTK